MGNNRCHSGSFGPSGRSRRPGTVGMSPAHHSRCRSPSRSSYGPSTSASHRCVTWTSPSCSRRHRHNSFRPGTSSTLHHSRHPSPLRFERRPGRSESGTTPDPELHNVTDSTPRRAPVRTGHLCLPVFTDPLEAPNRQTRLGLQALGQVVASRTCPRGVSGQRAPVARLDGRATGECWTLGFGGDRAGGECVCEPHRGEPRAAVLRLSV